MVITGSYLYSRVIVPVADMGFISKLPMLASAQLAMPLGGLFSLA